MEFLNVVYNRMEFLNVVYRMEFLNEAIAFLRSMKTPIARFTDSR